LSRPVDIYVNHENNMKIRIVLGVGIGALMSGSVGAEASLHPTNFHIKNRSNEDIFVQVFNSSTLSTFRSEAAPAVIPKEGFELVRLRHIENMARPKYDINTDKYTTITILDKSKKATLCKVIVPPKFTIYIEWDGKKLLPQENVAKGNSFTGEMVNTAGESISSIGSSDSVERNVQLSDLTCRK